VSTFELIDPPFAFVPEGVVSDVTIEDPDASFESAIAALVLTSASTRVEVVRFPEASLCTRPAVENELKTGAEENVLIPANVCDPVVTRPGKVALALCITKEVPETTAPFADFVCESIVPIEETPAMILDQLVFVPSVVRYFPELLVCDGASALKAVLAVV
jgi:predicted amidohydrolase